MAGLGIADERPEEDLRSLQSQSPSGLNKPVVPADHDTDLAEVRFENGVLAAGNNPEIGFVHRQMDLAKLSCDLSLAVDQDGGVVETPLVTLIHRGHNIG